MEETVEKILKAIKERPKITSKELQTLTGLSRRGIEYQLDRLKKEKIIERIGPTKGGVWKVPTIKQVECNKFLGFGKIPEKSEKVREKLHAQIGKKKSSILSPLNSKPSTR